MERKTKYWLHRVNYEGLFAYTLLKSDWLSMGFSDYGKDCDVSVFAECVESILSNDCEGFGKNRYYLKTFLSEMKLGDYVVVPLIENLFNIYKIETDEVVPLKDFNCKYFADFGTDKVAKNSYGYLESEGRIIDLGFFRKVSLVAENINVSQIQNIGLLDELKCWDTTFELNNAKGIELLQWNGEQVDGISDIIDACLEIQEQIDEEDEERRHKNLLNIAKKYFENIDGITEEVKADDTYDLSVFFERINAHILVNIQKDKDGTTDWALERIETYKNKQYKQQNSSLLWLVSTDYYLSEKIKSAAGLGIRLLSRKDFEEMCLNLAFNPHNDGQNNYSYRNQIKLIEKSIEGNIQMAVRDKAIIYPVIFELQNIKFLQNKLQTHLLLASKKYGIITNGVFYSIFKKGSDNHYVTSNVAELEDIIDTNNIDNKIIYQQVKAIKYLLSDYVANETIERLKFDGHKWRFHSVIEEIYFWEELLKCNDLRGCEMCKYTSINSVIGMLDNNTIRMSGLAGMNDTTEINYLDEYCKTGNANNPREYNKVYILSLNPDPDDLTMWRLYSGDAKGVNIGFQVCGNVTPSIYNPFIMHKMTYAERHGYHSKLEIIKLLISNGFEFMDIDRWKHFFKPYEYRVERETRLLYINSNVQHIKWTNLPKEQIINPYLDFDIKTFPLQPTKISLGPKYPERKINVKQLQTYIRQKGYNFKVIESKIDNYR